MHKEIREPRFLLDLADLPVNSDGGLKRAAGINCDLLQLSRSGSRSSPTSVQPCPLLRKYVRIGCRHVGCVSLSADMSTRRKLPAAAGTPRGASIVVVGLSVCAIGCVSSVALSKRNHDARYVTGPFATPAATAAFSNVNRPFASRRGATIGLTAVR